MLWTRKAPRATNRGEPKVKQAEMYYGCRTRFFQWFNKVYLQQKLNTSRCSPRPSLKFGCQNGDTSTSRSETFLLWSMESSDDSVLSFSLAWCSKVSAPCGDQWKSVKIRAANERDVTLSFSLSYEARSLGVVAALVEASSLESESVVFSTVIWMQ